MTFSSCSCSSTSFAEAGAWSCGEVPGLNNALPTVKELIGRIMTKAEQIIR